MSQIACDCERSAVRGSAFGRGFARGERDAFLDRRANRSREVPDLSGETLRGWLAGYTPRSSAWYRVPKPVS